MESSHLVCVCIRVSCSYLRSTLLTFLIRFSTVRSRVSSKFPASASLSKRTSFSQISGNSQKLLKESPRQLSCCRLPSSSGKDVRKFPSSQKVWRLQHQKKQRKGKQFSRVVNVTFSIFSEFPPIASWSQSGYFFFFTDN